MLLNKIPCLDNGYVALIDSHMTTQKLRDVGQEFYGGTYPTALENLGTLTIAMKCPLFVQLNLSKFDLRIIDANNSNQDVEAYKPNETEVGCKSLEDSRVIADDISRTTDALIINPKAYQADGCNIFISHTITPISVYTTLIVSGYYNEWCKFACQQTKLPTPIRAYTKAVGQILESEWKFNG